MKVFVQGSTGVLGRRLVRDFVALGHQVTGLTRSDEGDATVRSAGGLPVRGDPFDSAAMATAAQGCEVVIRAATAIPRSVRSRPSDFEETNQLRREGTKALLAASSRIGAKVFVQESIVWASRPADGSPYDESAPIGDDPINAAVAEAEHLAHAMAADGSLVATTLRFGNFYSPDTWHTRQMGERLANRKMPVIGTGASTLALIHSDDAASATVAAVLRPRSGVFHVVDDEPAPVRDFLSTFAAKIGARPPGHTSAALARLGVGRYTAEFFTIPMRTSSGPFREAFGWAPKYSTYRQGLDQIVSEWRKEGYLVGKVD